MSHSARLRNRCNLPRPPHPDPAGQHPGPDLGQPVPQVQRIGQQRPTGTGRRPLPRAELSRGELQHLRGTVTTKPASPLAPRTHIDRDAVRMVQSAQWAASCNSRHSCSTIPWWTADTAAAAPAASSRPTSQSNM
jgi:hypothetical protein